MPYLALLGFFSGSVDPLVVFKASAICKTKFANVPESSYYKTLERMSK